MTAGRDALTEAEGLVVGSLTAVLAVAKVKRFSKAVYKPPDAARAGSQVAKAGKSH